MVVSKVCAKMTSSLRPIFGLAVFFSFVGFSSFTQAEDLSDEPMLCGLTVEDVLNQISRSAGCFKAMSLARNCSFNSSNDVLLVEEAQSVCRNDLCQSSEDSCEGQETE